MPPTLLTNDTDDDDDSSVEEILPRDPGKTAQRDTPMADADDATGGDVKGADAKEDEDEDDDDEYFVERIRAHDWFPDEGEWRFETIWLGYPDPADYTWEPAENLEGAHETLEEYYSMIGGNPSLRYPHGPPAPEKKKKKKQKSMASGSSSSLSAATSPAAVAAESKKRRNRKSKGAAEDDDGEGNGGSRRGRPAKVPRRGGLNDDDEIEDPENWGPGAPEEWSPPTSHKDAWEDVIENIETIEPDEHGNKWVYLRWVEKDNRGRHRKSREAMAHVYRAAPQLMLRFYERHLVFGNPSKHGNGA